MTRKRCDFINNNLPVKNTNAKLKELDYMRVIACIGVIIIHISATGVTDYIKGSLPYIITVIINRSMQFVVPFFIFLSGVTSFHTSDSKEFNYFLFMKKKLEKVFLPYLIWCFVYYSANLIWIGSYDFNIISFLKGVLSGGLSYHLYFVIIIMQLYILGPLFYFVLKRVKNKIPLLIISAIFTAIFIVTLKFKFANRIFLKYMFFYMLGIYVSMEYRKYTSRLKKYRSLIILIYIAFDIMYIASYYYNRKYYPLIWFLYCTASIFFYNYIGLILSERSDAYYSFINLFSQSSYYIYLMHPIVLSFIIKYTAYIGIKSTSQRLMIFTIVVFPVSVISSLLYTVVKKKVGKHLRGKKIPQV